MLDDDARSEAVGLRQRRQRLFEQFAALVEQLDEVRGDRLRAAAYARAEQSVWDAEVLDRGDHDLLAAGLGAVVDWMGDATLRCQWASAESNLRLQRAVTEVGVMNHACEHLQDEHVDDPRGPPRDAQRECRTIERTLPRMQEIQEAARRSLRTAAARIRRFELPVLSSTRASMEWTALTSALGTATEACAWPN
jgi:hypothetical protein